MFFHSRQKHIRLKKQEKKIIVRLDSKNILIRCTPFMNKGCISIIVCLSLITACKTRQRREENKIRWQKNERTLDITDGLSNDEPSNLFDNCCITKYSIDDRISVDDLTLNSNLPDFNRNSCINSQRDSDICAIFAPYQDESQHIEFGFNRSQVSPLKEIRLYFYTETEDWPENTTYTYRVTGSDSSCTTEESLFTEITKQAITLHKQDSTCSFISLLLGDLSTHSSCIRIYSNSDDFVKYTEIELYFQDQDEQFEEHYRARGNQNILANCSPIPSDAYQKTASLEELPNREKYLSIMSANTYTFSSFAVESAKITSGAKSGFSSKTWKKLGTGISSGIKSLFSNKSKKNSEKWNYSSIKN